MTAPDDRSETVLQYHAPPTPARRRMLLLPLGVVPLVVEAIALGQRNFDSAPPTFEEFKAHHYWAAVSIVLTLAWLSAVLYAFRGRRHWELLLLCAVWCATLCAYAGWFLHRLNEHPLAAHYWSIWIG